MSEEHSAVSNGPGFLSLLDLVHAIEQINLQLKHMSEEVTKLSQRLQEHLDKKEGKIEVSCDPPFTRKRK